MKGSRVPAQIVRGFAMGAADVVPGVSGGTIALVFGIYETLVAQVHRGAIAGLHLLRLDLVGFGREVRRVDWGFLTPLVVGILAAVATLAGVIDSLLDDHPVETVAAFFGLVAASIVVAWGHLGRRDNTRMLVMVGTAVAAFVLLGFKSGEISDPAWFVVIGAGALAICAMILPGISGSFILLMLGLYQYVLDAVDERDLGVIVLFGVGAVVGLAAFSNVLTWALRRHRDTVVAALIGLMAGSLRVLWPWPAGADEASVAAPPSGDWVGPLVVAVAGAVAVLGIVGLGDRSTRR